MSFHDGFNTLPLKVGPGECPRVKEICRTYFGKSIAVPNTEMEYLVPAKKKTFQMQW